ncbi:hypothetical protein V1288_001500 [Bradyrhizobium sp. AZCC 2176]
MPALTRASILVKAGCHLFDGLPGHPRSGQGQALGNDENWKGQSMRRNLRLAFLLIAPLLTGCLERGQPTMADTSADDDAFCRANNVAVGSNDYVICRKNRDVQRGNANARADRAQRNLAEQMLNNPTRP